MSAQKRGGALAPVATPIPAPMAELGESQACESTGTNNVSLRKIEHTTHGN